MTTRLPLFACSIGVILISVSLFDALGGTEGGAITIDSPIEQQEAPINKRKLIQVVITNNSNEVSSIAGIESGCSPDYCIDCLRDQAANIPAKSSYQIELEVTPKKPGIHTIDRRLFLATPSRLLILNIHFSLLAYAE